MVYGRYNELVFMGIIMVYNQQTSLGGPILYKQLEKIERYSGSIAGWFFLRTPLNVTGSRNLHVNSTRSNGAPMSQRPTKRWGYNVGTPGDVNDGF